MTKAPLTPIDSIEPVPYKGQLFDVRRTSEFDEWISGFKDGRTRARILNRIDRLVGGNFGDSQSVGDGVQELRLHFGSGYRIYYRWNGTSLVLLLCGGDKSSQKRDIAKAKKMAKEAEDGVEDITL